MCGNAGEGRPIFFRRDCDASDFLALNGLFHQARLANFPKKAVEIREFEANPPLFDDTSCSTVKKLSFKARSLGDAAAACSARWRFTPNASISRFSSSFSSSLAPAWYRKS